MPTIDGQHRRTDYQDDHRDWCRRLFGSLADNGTWVVPRSGLTFTRRSDKLVLTARATGYDARDQQSDYNASQRQFALAGIEVTDES